MTDMTGTMLNSYAYDPFGTIISQQEAIAQPFKYVGQYGVMAEPNGLYYMRARYYDPGVGRFISEDPLGFDGGDVNLFMYAQNNPVNEADPDGLQAMVITPYGPLPLYLPNVPVQLTPGQSIQMQEDLAYLAGLFNPLPLLDWAGAQIAGTCEMAKGERGWGKRRGDDPLWGKSIQELKKIERESPDPAERERAKKIRKMKEKQRGMPNN